jgi:hypothetical protein
MVVFDFKSWCEKNGFATSSDKESNTPQPFHYKLAIPNPKI